MMPDCWLKIRMIAFFAVILVCPLLLTDWSVAERHATTGTAASSESPSMEPQKDSEDSTSQPVATPSGSWLRRHRKKLITAFMFTMHCLGFFTSIGALMDTRTSQGAVAWIISLNTVPYVAVPAYWVFGQSKFDDYEVLRRKNILASSETGRQTARILEEQGMYPELKTEHAQRQAELLEHLAKLPITRYNDAELLIDGEATFDAILEGITSAKEYILVQFYIMRDDGLGRRLKDALIDKAHQGVRVYVLYDALGSYNLPASYIAELRREDVLIRPFSTTRGKGNRFRLNYRNHRKIVVVDGDVAYVGGHNVGDEYLGKHPTLTPWRDTHVALRGPVVQFVQVSFCEDWLWSVGATPDWGRGAKYELDWDPEKASQGDKLALCLPTGPADDLETCTLFFLDAINVARQRLWIVSPYFVPDEQLMSALQLAALRGVDVRVLIPENPDQLLVYYSSFSYLEEAERSGVKIFKYQPGFLHQKVVLIDDDTAAIGTANFDNRSMRLNFEVTMLIVDEGFASEVEAMLEEDFAHSRQALATEYTEAPLRFRLMVRAARLLAPVQ